MSFSPSAEPPEAEGFKSYLWMQMKIHHMYILIVRIKNSEVTSRKSVMRCKKIEFYLSGGCWPHTQGRTIPPQEQCQEVG